MINTTSPFAVTVVKTTEDSVHYDTTASSVGVKIVMFVVVAHLQVFQLQLSSCGSLLCSREPQQW